MEETIPRTPRRRIHLMDEVRGFAVLCMVLHHALYNVGYLFDFAWGRAAFDFLAVFSPVFACAFVMISGVSSQLSRSNLVRGGKLLAIALLMTLVTALVMPSQTIRFGVLHMLAVCMIVFGLVQKPLQKVPMWLGLAVCAVLFALTAGLHFGMFPYIGVPGVPALQWIAYHPSGKWLFPLGIRTTSFASSDYYPILPWIFVFFAGGLLGRFAAADRLPQWMYRARVPFFSWVGKHALWVYILHQPLLYAIVYVLQLIF